MLISLIVVYCTSCFVYILPVLLISILGIVNYPVNLRTNLVTTVFTIVQNNAISAIIFLLDLGVAVRSGRLFSISKADLGLESFG